MSPGHKIGFIGGGQMAEALLRGILAKVRPQAMRRFPLQRVARGGLPSPTTTSIGIAPTPALLSPPSGISSSELRSESELEGVDVIPAGMSSLTQGWTGDNLHVWEPRVDQLERLAGELGVNACSSNIDLAKKCNVMILAVKPPAVPTVIQELVKAAALTPNHLLISIAAGLELDTFESKTPARVIRVMPNTPCLVQAGASAFSRGKSATEEDVQVVREIFGAVGILHEVPEHLMAAVTGLSGSGPAYVYEFIEALADGGVREGLPRELAMELAAATVRGAADMVLQTRKHPGELKDAVASPAGTTIEGIFVLEEGKFRSTAMKAVSASARRARELK